jgi:hypothetical protein
MFNNVHYLNSNYVYKLNDFKTRYRWWISSSPNHFYQHNRSRESSVGTVTRLQAGKERNCRQIPGSGKTLFFPQGSDSLWILQTPKFKGCWGDETALQLYLRSSINFLDLHGHIFSWQQKVCLCLPRISKLPSEFSGKISQCSDKLRN